MQNELNLTSKIKLNNGIEIPIFGLGTWLSKKGKPTEEAVLWALEAGYIHIDTAAAYGNEESVGIAIKKSKIDRDELFVTTKLWNDSHGYDETLKAIDKSLQKLQLKYVDLYLIHWPVPGKRTETWKAMERILKDGKARAIGISNFLDYHLKKFLPNIDIVPAVNQIEFHPYLYLKDLQEYCEKKGIKIEAYSPITHGTKLNDPKLVEIADKYGKTSAQVLIRWGLQHGLIEIPKSVQKDRIIENSSVFDFELTKEDMGTMDKFHENYRAMKDPDWVPTADRWKEK